VGWVLGAHGVRGLLKVESLSDNPARFAAGSQLYACFPQQQPRPLIVESAAPHKGLLLLACAGIESREAATALLGARLLAEPDAAALPPGQYYHYQLLGLQVYERGDYLGRVTEILSRPANDIYVALTLAEEEIWIPALKSVIKSIDLQAGRMEVELPPGLRGE